MAAPNVECPYICDMLLGPNISIMAPDERRLGKVADVNSLHVCHVTCSYVSA